MIQFFFLVSFFYDRELLDSVSFFILFISDFFFALSETLYNKFEKQRH